MLISRIHKTIFWAVTIALLEIILIHCYDPTDTKLESILPRNGTFEAFYPKDVFGVKSGTSRAPHGHGSFYKHRNPALVNVKNAAAYGYRFDGYRRFNFD